MKPIRKKSINIPLYNQWVVLTTDYKYAQSLTSTDLGDILGGTIPAGNTSIIYLNTDKGLGIDTISHECVHAAVMVLSHVGVPVKEENDEALAYLQGFIVRAVCKQLVKRGYVIEI